MGWINKKSNVKMYQNGGEITPSMSTVDTPIKERRLLDWDKKKKFPKKPSDVASTEDMLKEEAEKEGKIKLSV